MNLFGKLYKTKYWELEIRGPKFEPVMFNLHIRFDRKCDHTGFHFTFELVELFFVNFEIYDNRHWDYQNNRWEEYNSEGKLKDFGGSQEVADEYSNVKTCPMSDVGYHCNCYDEGSECHLCGSNK